MPHKRKIKITAKCYLNRLVRSAFARSCYLRPALQMFPHIGLMFFPTDGKVKAPVVIPDVEEVIGLGGRERRADGAGTGAADRPGW